LDIKKFLQLKDKKSIKSTPDDKIILNTNKESVVDDEVNLLDQLVNLFRLKKYDEGMSLLENNKVIQYLPNL